MSHVTRDGPYADGMKVREPVVRPLDVVAAEVMVTVSQAFVAGVLAYLAAGFWSERDVGSGPVVAILGAAAVAVSSAWLFWLLGGAGWPMALVDVPVALYMGFALLLGLQGTLFLQLDPLLGLLTLTCAVYGVVAGFFLDSPRRWRWDQRRTPRAGRPVPRVSLATERLIGRFTRPRSAHRPAAHAATSLPDPGREAVVAETDGPASSSPAVRMATPVDPIPAGLPRRPHVSAPDGDPREPIDVPSGRTTSGPAPGAIRLRSSGPIVRAGVDLPTTDEPKARRSPWAWASPPEWNRDDPDDEPAGGGESGGGESSGGQSSGGRSGSEGAPR